MLLVADSHLVFQPFVTAKQGVSNAGARLFSNPAGDYGSMVNERVGTGGWESGEELGDTWAARNSYRCARRNLEVREGT